MNSPSFLRLPRKVPVLLLLMMIALALSGCGRKPGSVEAPEGSTLYRYPPAPVGPDPAP